MKAQPQKWSTLEALTTLRKFISLFPLDLAALATNSVT